MQKTPKKPNQNTKRYTNVLGGKHVKNAIPCSVLIVANYRSQPLFLSLWCFQTGETTKLSANSFRVSVSTNSTVNFRRHDPINTTPVFPAGDPFLTPKHQGEKKETHIFFPCNTLHWWSLVHRKQITDYYFILLMSQQETKRLLVGLEEGAELWVVRTVLWLCLCPPSPSILEGTGWEWGRTGCAQEGGKQHLTMLTTVLISLSTGGNYSSLRKTKRTENEF